MITSYLLIITINSNAHYEKQNISSVNPTAGKDKQTCPTLEHVIATHSNTSFRLETEK